MTTYNRIVYVCPADTNTAHSVPWFPDILDADHPGNDDGTYPSPGVWCWYQTPGEFLNGSATDWDRGAFGPGLYTIEACDASQTMEQCAGMDIGTLQHELQNGQMVVLAVFLLACVLVGVVAGYRFGKRRGDV